MSSIGAAPCAAPLSPARAEASRRNGAKSRGPKTPEGKARSSRNALKHGLRAQKHVVLPEEDAAEFKALEKALIEELAPEGALQTVLAQRIVAATWRLARAERLEAELFAENHLAGRSLGLALIRDGNGSRSFDTLLRYRGGTLAELWRALKTLKALQAEQAAIRVPAVARPAALAPVTASARKAQPDEPESRGNTGNFDLSSDRADAGRGASAPALAWLPPWPLPAPGEPAPRAQPIEPTRGKPVAPPEPLERGASSLLGGTALVPPAGAPR